MRHRIFVGSSSEDLSPAEAIQQDLDRRGHLVTVWNQGVFGAGRSALESLLDSLYQYDAAVFVFAPNDLVAIRGREFDAVRDNVVFELGLFTGHLGRDRTFWVVPRGQTRLRIASDLLGVLPAEYTERADGNWRAAVAPPCGMIHQALVQSARTRGSKHPALPAAAVDGCLPQLNDAMQQLTFASLTDWTALNENAVVPSPNAGGFTVRPTRRSVLSVTFGRIEECGAAADDAVVLPANEFFDDECIRDQKSALGAFVMAHFGDRRDEFTKLVANARQRLWPALVESEAGTHRESYGVGTSLCLEKPLGAPFTVILTSVSRWRAGEGIKAEPSYIFAAVQSIKRVMNDRKLFSVHLPLLGSGHGGMENEVALFCLALALGTSRDIRRANIVLFQASKEKSTEIDPESVRKILACVAAQRL